MKAQPKLTHCVWWYDADPFSGRSTRNYRDFDSIESAERFAQTGSSDFVYHVGTIAECPWHHQHASITAE